MIIWDDQRARDAYWLYRLRQMFWVNLLIVIVLKCIAGFVQNQFYYLGHIIYLIELAFAQKMVYGFYFFFNEYLQSMYIFNGHYVILFIFIALANSFGYIFSTLFQDSQNKYNYLVGFVCMEVTTVFVCSVFKSTFDIMTMGITKYYWVVFFWSIINFYVAYDTYLILRFRAESYNTDDFFYAFYAIQCDWFSHFWLDIFSMFDGGKRRKK